MPDLRTLLRRRELALGLIVLLLILVVGARAPVFLTPSNLVELFNDTSILIILALGQMTVILTRCIDLSVAANLALTGMVTALLSAHMPELPIVVTLAVALGVGLGLGAINGFLVGRDRHPAHRRHARHDDHLPRHGLSPDWRRLGQQPRDERGLHRVSTADAPRPAGAGLDRDPDRALRLVVLGHTRFGRAFYAVGGNPRAAVYTGIRTGRIQFLAFFISGVLAGLCGYLWVSRYAVAYVDIAMGFELEVVAACVIGGISIAGGIGTVAGAVLGALFLGVVKNALPVVDISPFWQMAISGAAIIVAVVFNSRGERRVGRLILKEASIAAARGSQGAGA